MDFFSDTAANLNFMDSKSYYRMLREEISMYLPPKHPSVCQMIVAKKVLDQFPAFSPLSLASHSVKNKKSVG